MTVSTERTILTRLHEPDEAIEARMVEALDTVLPDAERLILPPNTMVFRHNDPMDAIYVVLEGQVKLYQIMEDREVIFHSQTVGRIIGLLALTRHSNAFFNCRTVSPVKLLKISFTQLEQALQHDPALLDTFIIVLLRSMARRSTRLVELQREVLVLNKDLAKERDALANALDELQKAQALLVESEKMATLGQLAAGVAHELNNPVAAIGRAADFIKEDLLALAAELPDGRTFQEMLDRSVHLKTLPTRELRAARRSLSTELGDEALAEQLTGMGITSAAEYRRLAAGLPGDETQQIERMHRYHQVGGALRNIITCAQRIADLVKSLRSYSRNDEQDTAAVDLHEGLEDTLRLFSNRLHEVDVERRYGELPRLRVNAGELNQVWTNLIANALDAMHNQGRLEIETATTPDGVRVCVGDSGPGISPENTKKIFDVRFTTRQGRIEFGLGLGLSISQNIVARHGGRIEVKSRPSHTRFCVYLPGKQQESKL